MGYLDDEAKTRDIVDEEGFLHSGDIGRFDPSGTYLYITGRIKGRDTGHKRICTSQVG